MNPFVSGTVPYNWFESKTDSEKAKIREDVSRSGLRSYAMGLQYNQDYKSFEQNQFKTEVQDTSNPYKLGTDEYAFYQSLTPAQKTAFSENRYLSSPGVLSATISARGGLTKALENPDLIVGSRSAGPNIGTYEYTNMVNPYNKPFDLGSFVLNVLTLTPAGTILGPAIGASLAPAASTAVQTAIGNAVVQGTVAEATGGDFLKGAALSGAGSLAGGVQSGLSEALGGGNIGQIGSNALIGGTMAELSGGDFAKGAVLSGVQSGIQQARLAAAEDYLRSIPTDGYDVTTAPTEADILDVIARESPNFKISDTTFRPDYSLSTGAPVIPEMGAQGIQVPTINQVIDVLDGVDYSLPAPNSGLGLVMPTAPNLDSMGGGQGITVPVAGGTLTEAGVIPESYTPVLGDPTSFINQPAPDSGVTITEPTEAAPKDISKELAALDIAKALAPAAVGALLAENLTSQKPESTGQQTGFPIVPIPSDWRSPEYNMAFTPSAPIDFGSPELLRGTQWERPINLSTVINALNQPMIAPEVQQMMTQFHAPTMPYETGINDIIGEIGGRQVSIAEIISGIQSGQNYGS